MLSYDYTRSQKGKQAYAEFHGLSTTPRFTAHAEKEPAMQPTTPPQPVRRRPRRPSQFITDVILLMIVINQALDAIDRVRAIAGA